MEQLCETCQNYAGGCSWTAIDEKTGHVKFEPVPGWTATPSVKVSHKALLQSYAITACPEYIPDPPREQPKKARHIYALDRGAILNMLLNGYTTAEIADVYDCREQTIYAIRRELRGAGLL